jgi:hypothetical protein
MSWLLLLLLFWKNLLSPHSTPEGTFETSTPFLEKKGCRQTVIFLRYRSALAVRC